MDPISAASAFVSLADIVFRTTSNLVEYTRTAAHASAERKALLEESLSLLAILDKLRKRHATTAGEEWLEANHSIIVQFRSAFDELANLLHFDPLTGQPKQQSRLRMAASAAKWPFSKVEVYSAIERITRMQQHAVSLLVDDQYSMVEQINTRQLDGLALQQRQDILSWLSPLQDEATFNTELSRVAAGSGQWFLESKEFIEWHTGDATRLWCSGIPGAGKTIIATLVVNYIRQRPLQISVDRPSLAFTYLKYNNPRQDLAAVVGSLLRQLLNSRTDIPNQVKDAYDLHQRGASQPDGDELVKLLHQATAEHTSVFYVVDALDECDEQLRWDLLRCLEGCHPRTRILITSRALETIADELCSFRRFEIRAHAQDMELYIDSFIDKHRSLRRMVDKSIKLRGEIKESVIRNAEDMYGMLPKGLLDIC
jgi:hypothetical protein